MYFIFRQVLFEAITEDRHTELMETRQITIVTHNFDNWANRVDMLTKLKETFNKKSSEIVVELWFFAFQKFYILSCQFERRGLEVQSTRWYTKDKSKVNMDNMSIRINQNITVVAILDLQNVS